MTIVIPDDYHTKAALQERRIHCIPRAQAVRQDIRAMRIGILNIMPEAESYEFSLLFHLGRSIIQVEPIWIRLKTHAYTSTNRLHIKKYYLTFEESIAGAHLDGLIVTGAPVEEIHFGEVTYWKEIEEILRYARRHIASTLGICWGGLALAKILGIEKEVYSRKLFGAFEVRNLDYTHPVTGEMDDIFWCPQSRFSGIADSVLEKEASKGTVNLLAHSDKAGYIIFESCDKKFLMHLGHHEYDAKRLVEEYLRDKKRGRHDVLPPENIDCEKPVNRWRAHGLEFFTQWIKYVYSTSPF